MNSRNSRACTFKLQEIHFRKRERDEGNVKVWFKGAVKESADLRSAVFIQHFTHNTVVPRYMIETQERL